MSKIKSNQITQKVLIKLGALYAIILAVINFIGYLIVTTSKLPSTQTQAINLWNVFKADNRAFIGMVMGILFLVPFILLGYYVLKEDEETLPGRIINLPVMYALIGAIGWLAPYVFELILLFYVGIHYKVSMHSVAVLSFFNVIQSALFIGAFAFMALDSLHRRFVLPKYYEDGKLFQYKGTVLLSVRVLIAMFYISVGIIPMFYMISALQRYSIGKGFEIERFVIEVFIGFIAIGVVMTYIFSRYFTNPLSELRNATDAIKAEKYNKKVKVISSDDFGMLADNFNDMAAELENKTKHIITIQESIIRGMAVMVESRDNSTGGHIYRTSECVKILVNKLQELQYRPDLDENYWRKVIKAAPMHDLGKISIDDAILRKPDKFTHEEYECMKDHAKKGAIIVESVLREVDDEQFKSIAINVAHFHHEKWDGTGYPNGMSKEQIPLEARVMALADVFDALVSKRCYKESMSFDQAFKIIEESLGTHFDPELGVIFIKCRPMLEELYSSNE